MASTGGYDRALFQDQSLAAGFGCPVCHRVLRKPYLTKCGRNVCESCLDPVRPCSLCNGATECSGSSGASNAVINRHMWNEILELKMFCARKASGCNWEGSIERYREVHEKECDYVEMECKYGCGSRVLRHQSNAHLLVCEYCPILCPNGCQATVTRHSCAAHLSSACPLQEIDCLFQRDGCEAKITRDGLQAHLDTELQTHFTLVAKSSVEARAKWEQQRDALIAEEDAKLKERNKEIATLSNLLQELEEKAASLQQILAATEREARNFEQSHRGEQERAAAELQACDAKVSTEHNKVDYLQKQMQVKCLGTPLPQYLHHVSRPIPPCPISDTTIPPLQMVVDNFSQRRSDDDCWYSDPFFSHRGGYKLCLEVYPNGYRSSRGKWVSIFVTLLKGEYDDYLNWPLSASLSVTFVCHNNRTGSVSQQITFSGSGAESQRVQDGYMAVDSRGVTNFILLNALYPVALIPERQYVVNNCVHIRVGKVTIK